MGSKSGSRRFAGGVRSSSGYTPTNGVVGVRRPGDKANLDDVLLSINGQRQYPWRAVDRHVPDVRVQVRRDNGAARRFFRNLVRGPTYAPRPVLADKQASHGRAKGEIQPRGRASPV